MPLGLGLASEPPGPASLWGLAFLRNDRQVHVRGNQRVRPWQNAGEQDSTYLTSWRCQMHACGRRKNRGRLSPLLARPLRSSRWLVRDMLRDQLAAAPKDEAATSG